MLVRSVSSHGRGNCRNVVRVLALALLVILVVAALLIGLHSAMFCSPYVCSIKRRIQSTQIASRLQEDASKCTTGPIAAVNQSSTPRRPTFVVASMQENSLSWLDGFSPTWETHAFVMDSVDVEEKYRVPQNKGHEAMAYLTFIINNYDNLPEVMVFLHGCRYQWHNEDPFYDGIAMLSRLRVEHVLEEGFASVRCTWEIGCPVGLQPFRLTTQLEATLEPFNVRSNMVASYAQAYRELFPNDSSDIPSSIGIPCGGQFAVSAERVRERPLCDYRWYRDWLLATKLPDTVSGRIFEYSYHIIFGMPAVTCPDASTCFCQKYGMCNLTCTEGSCGRYRKPPSNTLPKAWPELGPGTNGLPVYGWEIWMVPDKGPRGPKYIMGWGASESYKGEYEIQVRPWLHACSAHGRQISIGQSVDNNKPINVSLSTRNGIWEDALLSCVERSPCSSKGLRMNRKFQCIRAVQKTH